MPDPLTAELKHIIETDGYLHLEKIGRQLAYQPYSQGRYDLIEDFLTGKLVNHAQLNKAETDYLYGNLINSDTKMFFSLMQILYDGGRLTYDLFKNITYRHYDFMTWRMRTAYHNQVQMLSVTEVCFDQIVAFYHQMLDEIIHDLTPIHCQILSRAKEFSGSRYLVLGTEKLITHQVTKLKISRNYPYDQHNTPDHIIARMAETTADDINTPEKRDALIAQLREVVNTHSVIDKTAPFKLLFPVAVHFRDVLCEVLGWEDMIPLMRYIGGDEDWRQKTNHEEAKEFIDDIEHIQVAEVYELLANIPKERVIEVLSLILGASADGHRRAFLILALLGINRAEVMKKFKYHALIAIKAYGLLPLTGDETVLSRYLALRESAKLVKKLGPRRKISHANAIQVAIDYLAQQTDYLDGNRLEWAMEAQLATETPRQWVADDYIIQLEQDGIEMALIITKEGRALKSVPKAVRGTVAYTQAMDTLKQLRAQLSRFRTRLLEGFISSGEMLLADDMTTLLRLPIARALFPALIWRNMAGDMGLLDVDEMVLIDCDGQTYPVSDALRLAHSYDLFQAGKLADWQHYIVHHRIVQPIKQAFRELYILTPAEKETATYSNRFMGHMVAGRMVAQLLAGRGWRMNDHYDHATPYKQFGDMRAVFRLMGVWSYLGREGAPTASNQIYFEPKDLHKKRTWRSEPFEEEWLPLETIPPLIFSEVMRDADLVVSVAQQEGGQYISKEVYLVREQLITALLDDLGLPNVRVDGHFAHITGKLADYRVHLGSAVIHIEPGNYLCIVPARWGMTHEKLFLPFADEKDGKISEVISKILLLLADDKIKDESILRQIRQKSL